MRKYLVLVLLLALFLSSCQTVQPVAKIDVLFSPKGGIQERIIEEIERSQSIDIAIYSFTNKNIIQALRDAQEDQDAVIRVLMGDENKKQAENVRSNGLEVKIKHGKGYMHNKFIIFDERLVMTGSYNLSKNAELYSDENALFILDKAVIKEYQNRFEELWGKGK